MALRIILVLAGFLGGAGGIYLGALEPARSELSQMKDELEEAKKATAAAQAEARATADKLSEVEALSCFDLENDEDIAKAKDLVMPFVKAADIDAWTEKQRSRIDDFLKQNDFLRWSQGNPVEGISFEEDLVKQARGKWNARIKFDDEAAADLGLKVAMGFGKLPNKSPSPHKITVTSSDGGYKSTLVFQRGPLGTYAADEEVSVVFASPVPEGIDGTSHYGFRFDPSAKRKSKQDAEVYGLTKDLEWIVIGSAQVERK